MPRAATLAALVVLAAAAAAPYLLGLRHEFVYDDFGQIIENVFLRNPAHVKDVLLLRTVGNRAIINGRRPLVLLTYFADRALWGARPAGYRVTNLLFHAGSVLALCALARRLGGQGSLAFTAALLFGLHPALIEAVHVPAFRPDAMYTFFVLVYLWAALGLTGSPQCRTAFPDREARRGGGAGGDRPHRLPADGEAGPTMGGCRTAFPPPGGRRWGRWKSHRLPADGEAGPTPAAGTSGWRVAAVLIALILALASKEAAAIAPAVLAGIWICFPATRPGRWMMGVVLGASTLLVAGWLALGAGSGIQAVDGPHTGTALTFPTNLLTLPWLWTRWLGILVWPYPLIVDRVVAPVASAAGLRFAAGAALLAATVLAAAFSIRKRPWLALGLGWMLAGFLPTSNLVPLFNPLAERYLYFAAAGFAVIVARALADRGSEGWRAYVRYGALGVICAGYATIGVVRMADWKDNLTLWSRTLKDEPRSARAHTWVGLELKTEGRLGEALMHFEAADKLNPQEVAALINKGILYGQAGDLPAAERALRLAVQRRPDKAAAHWNLAVALQFQGRMDEALREIDETLRLDPMHIVALKAKAVLLAQAGRQQEAAECLARVLELDPGDADARSGLNHGDTEITEKKSNREKTQKAQKGSQEEDQTMK
ncbi:MAG: tetratricopeptide repeat protein [Kiritimatiellae bacterium]|nr:tetratricopeptide repeat protein [Kiritimatiellia bacterium]